MYATNQSKFRESKTFTSLEQQQGIRQAVESGKLGILPVRKTSNGPVSYTHLLRTWISFRRWCTVWLRCCGFAASPFPRRF